MRVGIVGAGRAAWSFAALFRRLDWTVVGVASRREPEAFVAAGIPRTELPRLVQECELVLLAVNDPSIEAVAHDLRALGEPITFHVSGALSSDVLPFRRRFTLHPLLSLPAVGAEVRLEGGLFVFEGNDDEWRLAEALSVAAGARLARISSLAKPTYHSAAVFASNYVAALLSSAEQLMHEAGVEESGDALAALARSAVENWRANRGDGRFTGPIVRGDLDRVEQHLSALSGEKRALYAALGKALVAELEPNEQRDKIAQLLRAGSS